MDGRFRVLYVVRQCSGGMLTHLQDLLQYLDRKLFQPLVAGPPSTGLTEMVTDLEVDFHPLAVGEDWRPWRSRRVLARLNALLRKDVVHLVHTHGVQAGLVGRSAAHGAGLPVVSTVHNLVYSRPGPAWQKTVLAWYQRRLVSCTDCFIAVSEALSRELQQVEHVPADKIVTIYNGIDLNRLEAVFSRTRDGGFSLLAGGPYIGTIARLIPEKGVDLFLRACAEVRREQDRARFLVIGEGPGRPQLEELACRLGLRDRVLFLGRVEEAAAFLPLLDVYVQPSRQEGLSLAVLEAMAAGCPVVASRTGGLAEIVRPGETGYLVPAGDWKGLAREILRLLREPELGRRLGQGGRRLVAQRHQVGRMVEATEEVYCRVLATRLGAH